MDIQLFQDCKPRHFMIEPGKEREGEGGLNGFAMAAGDHWHVNCGIHERDTNTKIQKYKNTDIKNTQIQNYKNTN